MPTEERHVSYTSVCGRRLWKPPNLAVATPNFSAPDFSHMSCCGLISEVLRWDQRRVGCEEQENRSRGYQLGWDWVKGIHPVSAREDGLEFGWPGAGPLDRCNSRKGRGTVAL